MGTGNKTLLRHAVEEEDEVGYMRGSYERAPKCSALQSFTSPETAAVTQRFQKGIAALAVRYQV